MGRDGTRTGTRPGTRPGTSQFSSISLHRYMFICPYHNRDTCLCVPITSQIHVCLSLSLHRYMFICPYHSTDTCIYMSLSLHRYMFMYPYHSTDTCLCVPITIAYYSLVTRTTCATYRVAVCGDKPLCWTAHRHTYSMP